MTFARYLLIIILLIYGGSAILGQNNIISPGQNQRLDSLMNLYKKTKHDTTKIILLNEEIGYSFERKNPDSAIFYYEKAINLANKDLLGLGNNSTYLKTIYLKLKANSLRYIGIVFYEKGTFDKAIQFVLKSLKIYEQLITLSSDKQQIVDCKNGLTQCYVPLGNIQYDQGNFSKALEYFFKALKIHEELGNTQQISGCYVNIGNVYFLFSALFRDTR